MDRFEHSSACPATAWCALAVVVVCGVIGGCSGNARSASRSSLHVPSTAAMHAPTPTGLRFGVASVGHGLRVRFRLATGTSTVQSGSLIPVEVTVTNTSSHLVGVGACLSTFVVYPAFVDRRSGRILSGPIANYGCTTELLVIQPGHSRTYRADARAITGVPLTMREQPLPPGDYAIALRAPYRDQPIDGLDRVPPLNVTVVA